ncbi:MAG: nitroreductase family deazaflavin-dependent oxidoreductase [Deltaproteobacteria bacterium]|nr:nitroreductase family deazaflavin-dependent oxidoreductase [Deltaproteobacteria bacterium]
MDRIRGDAKADVDAYLANPEGWSTGAGPSGLPTLLLTCVGRKSGEKRTTPLVFLQHGKEMVVVGSLGGYDTHPAWVHNLKANPECWVQLDANRRTATSRDATDAEREALWPDLTALFPPWGYFQKQTDRPFAIVLLSSTGPA